MEKMKQKLWQVWKSILIANNTGKSYIDKKTEGARPPFLRVRIFNARFSDETSSCSSPQNRDCGRDFLRRRYPVQPEDMRGLLPDGFPP